MHRPRPNPVTNLLSTLLLTLSALLATTSAQSATIPVTGILGNASETQGDPDSAQYIATFPDSDVSTIRGTVVFDSAVDGNGVSVSVAISGLPSSGGPFLYHIHQFPVLADGNCTATGAHLDPYLRGESPPCDPTLPQTCQLGDLAGKHGNITGTAISTQYTDVYLSTLSGQAAFMGNLSVVVHDSSLVRIACTNVMGTAADDVASPAGEDAAEPGVDTSVVLPALMSSTSAAALAATQTGSVTTATATATTTALSTLAVQAVGAAPGGMCVGAGVVVLAVLALLI